VQWQFPLPRALFLGFWFWRHPAARRPFFGTATQTNDRIRSLSAASRVGPHDYVIGSGDVLSVDVFDVKELSRDVRVSQTGSIGLPLVPVRLRVAGLTELAGTAKNF